MKKIASTLAVLVVLLSLTVGTVLADGVMYLREARNDAYGNVIFVFNYTGDFSKSDLKGGIVFFGDVKLPLDCNIVSDEVIQCTTSRKAAGQHVTINLGGFVFYTFVPERTGRSGGGGDAPACYSIYNSQTDQQEESSFWVEIDTHCPDVPPSDMDKIEYDGWWYEFWNLISDGYCGVDANSESGYFEMCLG